MCCVVIYEERFCKREEERYEDLLEIWQQDEWSFRILKMREGQCVMVCSKKRYFCKGDGEV